MKIDEILRINQDTMEVIIWQTGLHQLFWKNELEKLRITLCASERRL